MPGEPRWLWGKECGCWARPQALSLVLIPVPRVPVPTSPPPTPQPTCQGHWSYLEAQSGKPSLVPGCTVPIPGHLSPCYPSFRLLRLPRSLALTSPQQSRQQQQEQHGGPLALHGGAPRPGSLALVWPGWQLLIACTRLLLSGSHRGGSDVTASPRCLRQGNSWGGDLFV